MIYIHNIVIYIHIPKVYYFILNLGYSNLAIYPSMNIGFILKELRTIKKITQQQIASKLNIERSTYAKWETGKVMLKVDQLKELCILYGVDFEYMARCVEAEKVISRKDIERFIYLQEQKELALWGGG